MIIPQINTLHHNFTNKAPLDPETAIGTSVTAVLQGMKILKLGHPLLQWLSLH